MSKEFERSQSTSRWAFAAAVPGVVLCASLTTVAIVLQKLQERVFGHPYLEAIVISILLGILVRTAWAPGARWKVGIALSAKQFLEIAVALLGASITFSTLVAVGPELLCATVFVVIVTLGLSYCVGVLLGLSGRLALLVACGNSICGNSAIAAVAPVIGASSDDVAASIAFTAILGVIVVLALPLLIPLAGLSETQYGIVAGMTVYAVPQVLAATLPVSLVSTQIGTVVKLVRVMTLGPVVAGISVLASRFRIGSKSATSRTTFDAMPWFIVVFFTLAALRSFSLIPASIVLPIQTVASVLTVLSMAALGLGVDLRVIGRVGVRVTAAVTISLVLLFALSLILVRYVLMT